MVNHAQPIDAMPGGDALAITGPTASGKTALALRLAQTLPLEIISVDSALVYQGMDIGTAKPTADELASVPHHLVNVRDPSQAYSAAEFARDAARLIQDIKARNKLPLLVGGTMLYFKALIEGLDNLPLADAQLRANMEGKALALGWPALHAELALVDPESAARLPPNDAQRISRALEVWHLTGQPLSTFFGTTRQAGPSITLLSLEPQQRSWLHHRIAHRFDSMLAQGLIEEVLQLRLRGDLHRDMPSMRCVGYRQVWEALDMAGGDALNAKAIAALREKGIAASRQLAKRQLTWLRSMPHRHVLPCDADHVWTQTQAILRQIGFPGA